MVNREEHETLEALRQIEHRLEQIVALLEQLLGCGSQPMTYARPVGFKFSGKYSGQLGV